VALKIRDLSRQSLAAQQRSQGGQPYNLKDNSESCNDCKHLQLNWINTATKCEEQKM